MRLRNLIAGFLLFALTFSSSAVLAHEIDAPHEESADPVQIQPNSFELFWPLVAGKTVDDGFVYTLKRIKETVRGWLIFGKAQKADYAVFLATKRVLEAEKLLNEDKRELADKTLGVALNQLEIAEENTTVARGTGTKMIERLDKINILTSWLSSKTESENLKKVSDKVVVLINQPQ